jgi:hypothetical protein
MILDFNRYRGRLDLNNTTNFNARWNGPAIRSKLGSNTIANPSFANGMQLVNSDNNALANDLLITAAETDANVVNKKVAAGGVFYIKDINRFTGVIDLNNADNFAVAWTGSLAGDRLGYTTSNGQGVQLVKWMAESCTCFWTLIEWTPTNSGT